MFYKIFSELSINFHGWFVEGRPIATAKRNDNVTAKITLSWGKTGIYSIRIRRDIARVNDETITALQFIYDGKEATKQITFIPLWVTGESGTHGFHIDILKDTDIVWTMAQTYPPRLRVKK